MKKEIIVEVSARHLHISQADYKTLFNKDELTKMKDISQPGQFAANETVTLHGSKGEIGNVRILGPFRSQTQIELAKTDIYTLGIEAPLRLSGQLKDSGGVLVVGPAGHIEYKTGVILALRHLHISETKAAEWNLKHGQNIRIRVGEGESDDIKDMVFEEIIVRVDESYTLACHIDTDEANAANINKSTLGIILDE
jgi:putative phosphotransacetylase